MASYYFSCFVECAWRLWLVQIIILERLAYAMFFTQFKLHCPHVNMIHQNVYFEIINILSLKREKKIQLVYFDKKMVYYIMQMSNYICIFLIIIYKILIVIFIHQIICKFLCLFLNIFHAKQFQDFALQTPYTLKDTSIFHIISLTFSTSKNETWTTTWKIKYDKLNIFNWIW